MPWQWVSVDLRTGTVLADLPLLSVDWPLRRSIGRYETGTARLPWPSAPENWLRATQPGASALIGYDDTDPLRTPQWGGMVVTRTRNTTRDTAELNLATIEAYLDRRYITDATLTYADTAQSLIVQDLIERYVQEGTLPGLPITVDVIDDGTLRDRTYHDSDDATVYQRLTELMGVVDGPEWFIDWEWSSTPTSIKPVLHVGTRVGLPATGDSPAAVFRLAQDAGSVVEAELVDDYTTGFGANDVTAVSIGDGVTARPTSGPQRPDNYLGRPTFEYRWTPSTSITTVSVLVDYAQKGLDTLIDGSKSTALTAQTSVAPKFGTEWGLGDDIALTVDHPILGGTLTATARAIAVDFYQEQVSPILATSDDELAIVNGQPVLIEDTALFGFGFTGGFAP